ncbi:glycosyltransferase [Pedobacter chinensis]|uniref:Glycosyltransferase n=1 Tax=Pedobacter chinensis TaxID=2282421 RepID=A0A369PU23_9SPHI|nr:glycosyltransferase family 4 protein [Pedobacter chinensis]RDC54755.1 glycosyltransferase [Pedobacter chinensis]
MSKDFSKKEGAIAPKKILFITPFFGRTGSEMQLLYILENLNTKKFQPYLFTRNDGSLLNDLPKYIKYFIGYKKHKNYLFRLFRLLLYAVNINPVEFQLRKIQNKVRADYWYINTIVNRDAYAVAVKLGIKIISHVHEMPLYYDMVKEKTIENLLKSDLCIGCSKVVCQNLEDMGHTNVKLLNSFVDDRVISLSNDKISNEFNFSANDFIWVMAGSVNAIKGVDFVIPLLKVLKSNHKIIWIGGIEDSGTTAYAKIAGKIAFKDRLFFVGRKSTNYYDYFNLGKAFLLLSRQDSFPLVMQEAAHLGKPIAGFNSGGIEEYVNEKIGIVVNQLSFIELAKAMEKIEKNYESYDQGYIKQYAKSFNASEQTLKLESILEQNL